MSISSIFSFTYLIFISFCIYIFQLNYAFIGIYLILSTLTFIVYFIDKRAAIKNKYRISENTLHLLSFLGGWPGALLAQNILRHKSVKQPFKAILWITIFLNCILFLYFIIPNSSIYLDKIL